MCHRRSILLPWDILGLIRTVLNFWNVTASLSHEHVGFLEVNRLGDDLDHAFLVRLISVAVRVERSLAWVVYVCEELAVV